MSDSLNLIMLKNVILRLGKCEISYVADEAMNDSERVRKSKVRNEIFRNGSEMEPKSDQGQVLVVVKPVSLLIYEIRSSGVRKLGKIK